MQLCKNIKLAENQLYKNTILFIPLTNITVNKTTKNYFIKCKNHSTIFDQAKKSTD